MYSDAQVGILGIGGTLAVASCAAIWRTASLRADINEKFSERVDVAKAGLDERAIDLLRELQVKADQVLGDPSAPFDPETAVADPQPFVQLTTGFQKTIRARRRLDRRFRWLLNLCGTMFIPALMFGGGSVAVACLYASDGTPHLARSIALIWTGAWLACGLLVVVLYAYLNAKIAAAEILSKASTSGARR